MTHSHHISRALLANFSLPPSDRRSDFVPANGGDFVLPVGQDFVRATPGFRSPISLSSTMSQSMGRASPSGKRLTKSPPPSDRWSVFACQAEAVVRQRRLVGQRPDFVPQYTKHYPTSKHWEAESSIFCENRENFATELRENFHLRWREFPLRRENFAFRRDLGGPKCSRIHNGPLVHIARPQQRSILVSYLQLQLGKTAEVA